MGEGDIGQLRLFLDYGPIGIAGLSLVLAIVGLMSANLDENRFKLLRLVLFFGAFSLVTLLTAEFMQVDAEHEMKVRVVPHDNDSQDDTLPAAFVQVNEVEIDRGAPYDVDQNIIVSVDVTRAIQAVAEAQAQTAVAQASVNESTDALDRILSRLTEVESVLDEAQSDLSDAQSSGGLETLRLSNSISTSLEEVSRTIAPELNVIQSE
jgi:hypothetical protein